jgi:hypothetical protein
MRPLTKCANGCDRPPDPPSLVICRACQDKITRKLEAILARMDGREASEEAKP